MPRLWVVPCQPLPNGACSPPLGPNGARGPSHSDVVAFSSVAILMRLHFVPWPFGFSCIEFPFLLWFLAVGRMQLLI